MFILLIPFKRDPWITKPVLVTDLSGFFIKMTDLRKTGERSAKG
jgi:hypothetical protein